MRIVLCNCPPANALPIARRVVEARLAACVNILPAVRSVYVWDGKVVEDEEHTLLLKTTAERVADLSAALRLAHPYDTPEILVLGVDEAASDPRYVAWVRAVTSEDPDGEGDDR